MPAVAVNDRGSVRPQSNAIRGDQAVYPGVTDLSGVLLLGLVANSLFGRSWADPVSGLVIAAVAVREGREAWRGEACCPVPVTGESGCGPECDCC